MSLSPSPPLPWMACTTRHMRRICLTIFHLSLIFSYPHHVMIFFRTAIPRPAHARDRRHTSWGSRYMDELSPTTHARQPIVCHPSGDPAVMLRGKPPQTPKPKCSFVLFFVSVNSRHCSVYFPHPLPQTTESPITERAQRKRRSGHHISRCIASRGRWSSLLGPMHLVCIISQNKTKTNCRRLHV